MRRAVFARPTRGVERNINHVALGALDAAINRFNLMRDNAPPVPYLVKTSRTHSERDVVD